MSKICRKEGLELRKNLPGYLLMAPAVIAVLALSVYPLFRGIYLSFLNYNLVRPNDPAFNTFAGLQNYINIFKDTMILILRNGKGYLLRSTAVLIEQRKRLNAYLMIR